MKKRILILGGSRFQVPLIERAKQRGLHVITCDYLPANPGHKLADEYHNVSTTDRDAVLDLARGTGIDAVASLSSDPAMPAVAHVASALGLPGPPLEAVTTLTEKDVLRRLMSGIGVPTPRYYILAANEGERVSDIAAMLATSSVRHLIKPNDSTGSRGVTVVEPGDKDATAGLRRAFEHSRAGRCIVEEYIDGEQIEGDGYLVGGRLVHHYLGDQTFFTKTRNSIPILTRWPTRFGEAVLREVVSQVEAIAQAGGYLEGPVNIEARITYAGTVYIIEIGPRNGGSYIPIIQQHLTGFDFVGRVLDSALGIKSTTDAGPTLRGIGAVCVLHADRDGTYAGLKTSNAIRDKILLIDIFKRAGDAVFQYIGSDTALGCVLLRFDNLSERDRFLAEMQLHLAVELQ